MNYLPLKAPKVGLRVRYRTADTVYAVIGYGQVCDLTPDSRWVKVKPNHPRYHRRWLPIEWVWELCERATKNG
jgi:hypothetical protein